MSIHQLKTLVWVSAGALGAGLCAYVVLGLQHLRNAPILSLEEQKTVLDGVVDPEPPRDEIVGYDDVKRGFHALDWTGKPPPPPPAPVDPAEVAKKPKKAVSTLLKVLFVKVDLSRGDNSVAWVRYTEAGLGRAPRDGSQTKEKDVDLRQDERLPEPYADIRLLRIEQDGLVFAFDDTERPEEQVPFLLAFLGDLIVQVGPDGLRMPPAQGLIVVNNDPPPFNPAKTVLLKPGWYQIGFEDYAVLQRDFAKILSEEVDYRPHRDPVTGKYDGIEIKQVKPNSMAASLGATSGDIIKSINGHPVSTEHEAIGFVKANDDKYDVWEVEVVNMGKTKTITYAEPKK